MTAWRVAFVASLVSTTVAPGSTAPCWSVMTPRKLPAFWANADEAVSTTRSAMARRPIDFDIAM